jgi:hypothetical protein
LVNFIKTVQKVKEVMKEEIISGNDTGGHMLKLTLYKIFYVLICE